MLPSAKKDSIPIIHKSCVIYEFSCRCEARYAGRTTQRLADRIKQHAPTSIRKTSDTVKLGAHESKMLQQSATNDTLLKNFALMCA